jgi:hypothetical protein
MVDEYLVRTRAGPESRGTGNFVADDGEETVDRLARSFSPCQPPRGRDELGAGFELAELQPDLVLVHTRMLSVDGPDQCRCREGASGATMWALHAFLN